MFIETSEVKMPPDNSRWILRNYDASGILKNISGLIFTIPYGILGQIDCDSRTFSIVENALND